MVTAKLICVFVFVYAKCSLSHDTAHLSFTVKFLNFGMPEIFAVIYPKFKHRGENLKVLCHKDANGIVNSEYSDQAAPLGAV